jgi:hypothetical protein
MKPKAPQGSSSSSKSSSKPVNRGRVQKPKVKKAVQSDVVMRNDVKSKKEMALQYSEGFGTPPFKSYAQNLSNSPFISNMRFEGE